MKHSTVQFGDALRAYRRRQNHYAKTVEGLQRALTVQQLIRNWIRPHWSLGKRTTPAIVFGLLPASSHNRGIPNDTRTSIHH